MEVAMKSPITPITAREQDVLRWLSQGKQNREIAQLLHISEVAVEKHLSSIYRKLGVRNRVEAVLHPSNRS
jgi:DNA-binding CsgD family transcriptional regulator